MFKKKKIFFGSTSSLHPCDRGEHAQPMSQSRAYANKNSSCGSSITTTKHRKRSACPARPLSDLCSTTRAKLFSRAPQPQKRHVSILCENVQIGGLPAKPAESPK
ncbi:hypothetical protein BaRGS_00003914 [Batillaria attramentaria]|uniref:Uncharacterized protein n=1 Tax=Batillaria attramentaria TaxID=370345 RepID=A0ABD0M0M8_9CAEN